MKRTVKDWLIVLASLLDDAGVIVIILLVLWFLKIPISLPLVVILILMFIALVFIMHKLITPVLHRRIITGSEGMVGLEGSVVKPLTPKGTIMVKGEYWKARTAGTDILADEQVEIVAVNGLTLQVKSKK